MIESKTRVYYEIRAALTRADVRYVDNAGGTRSGKTFSTLQVLVELAKGSRDLLISVVSETMPHLKRGAIRDFKAILADEWNDGAWNKTESIYTFPTGSIIEFFSADQPGKVHGPARDVLFINEANHISYDTARQLLVRTRLFAIFDYNPTAMFWVHEQIAPRANCVSIHSTYQDNPFLTDEQVAEIESNKGDNNWWRVYGLGLVGQAEGLIYTNWEQCEALPEVGGRLRSFGLDYGFSNSYTALVECIIDRGRREIWAREHLYKRGIINEQIVAAMERAEVPRHSTPVWADCAEPKSNKELRLAGFNIQDSQKSVRIADQLTELTAWRLYVTKDSVDFIKELRGYAWAQDKSGAWLNEPVKELDHACDAYRYACYPYIGHRSNASIRIL